MTEVSHLYMSLEEDNHKELHKLLIGGANVNLFFEDDGRLSGKALLHLCCEKSKTECAKLLIRNGADINIRDKWGQTPLMYCIAKRNLALAEFILSRKRTAVRCQDKFGKSALHLAVEECNEEAVKLLLRCGCDVNVSTMCGVTPLMTLCSQPIYSQQMEILNILLDAGALVNMRDFRCKRSALQLAGIQKNVKIVEKLLAEGADPNSLDRTGRSTLTNVIGEFLSLYEVHGEIDADVMTIIVLLTQSGTDLNMTKCKHSNPLVVATFLKVEPLVRYFLNNGADPNISFQSGVTPLMIAVNKGDLAIARALVTHGCSMEVKGRVSRRTGEDLLLDPLQLALENASWDIVRFFVSAGYNLSKLDYLRSASPRWCSVPPALRFNPEMLSILRRIANKPKPLYESALLTVWRCVRSPDLSWKVHQLPLPTTMKNLLVSEDFIAKF